MFRETVIDERKLQLWSFYNFTASLQKCSAQRHCWYILVDVEHKELFRCVVFIITVRAEVFLHIYVHICVCVCVCGRTRNILTSPGPTNVL